MEPPGRDGVRGRSGASQTARARTTHVTPARVTFLVLCRRDQRVFGRRARHRGRRYRCRRGVPPREPELASRRRAVEASDDPSLGRESAEPRLPLGGPGGGRRRVSRPVRDPTHRRTARGVLQPRRMVRAPRLSAPGPSTAPRAPRAAGLPLHGSLPERERRRAQPPAPVRGTRHGDRARAEPSSPEVSRWRSACG